MWVGMGTLGQDSANLGVALPLCTALGVLCAAIGVTPRNAGYAICSFVSNAAIRILVEAMPLMHLVVAPTNGASPAHKLCTFPHGY